MIFTCGYNYKITTFKFVRANLCFCFFLIRHCVPASNRHGDPNLTTTEKPSLRTTEGCLAIPLMTTTPKSHHEPAECRRGDRILTHTKSRHCEHLKGAWQSH